MLRYHILQDGGSSFLYKKIISFSLFINSNATLAFCLLSILMNDMKTAHWYYPKTWRLPFSLGWRTLPLPLVSFLCRMLGHCWSLFWRMLYHCCHVGFSFRRYFAAKAALDSSPPNASSSRYRIGLSFGGCFAAIATGCLSRLIWVDAFPPQLCLFCRQPLC